jgi:hypothetical protein
MELCSDGHDEICYNSRYCPLCDMRDDLEDYIIDLEQEVSDLKLEQNNG